MRKEPFAHPSVVNDLQMETSVPGSSAHMEADLRTQFLDIVLGHETIRVLVERLAQLDLPDAYLAAGSLCQTVWNHVSGFPPGRGITDYDVLYCDLDDLGWEGEDQIIRRCATAFADLGVEVEVRNQARVHLWYPAKFGVPRQPLLSTKSGIDSFLHCCSALGLRQTPGGYDVYAPFGFDDVFGMVVRPNYVDDLPGRFLNLPGRYEEKADRWRRTWPGVVVVPWNPPDRD